MNKNERGFGAVELLIVFVVVGLIGLAGWLVYDRQQSKTDSYASTTQANQQEQKQESSKVIKDDTKYLEIKEYGLRIVLTKDIEDAYYVMNPYPYLSVHSLDKYQNCKAAVGNQSSYGVAAVSMAKVGDENFGTPFTQKELEDISSLKIGENYYWIMGGNGGACSADSEGNNFDSMEPLIRKAFTEAKLEKL